MASWALPERITAAASQSPWQLPTDVFVRRAEQYLANPVGPSFDRARQALHPAGSVLDVGAGAGAASLPLHQQLTDLTAVDTEPAMLAALADRASGLGLPTRTVLGRWPEVADLVPMADLVVCHHVFFNVPDLASFALELTRHARRRVVAEITAVHPVSPLNPLWQRLHGLARPVGPTAEDAIEVLAKAGIDVRWQRWPRPPRTEYSSFDQLLSVTRRRLCLPEERTGELAAALLDLGVDPAHPRDLGGADDLVSLWWDIPGWSPSS
ncbi:MAG TPA: class I SAM-dependent methyltransferase [Micromonosporaceae bacterium]